jgi:hypothetical protein
MDCFILGFPEGMIGAANTPIWKRGSIASEPYQQHPYLVDSATRKGMSGAPVIARHTGIFGMKRETLDGSELIGTVEKFVAIYSGRIPGDDSLGYQLGKAWQSRLTPRCRRVSSRTRSLNRVTQQEWAEGPLTLEPNRSRASMPAKSASTRIATFSAFLPKLLSGAPVSVFAAFERAAYTVTKGEILNFRSSPRTQRGFRARCGSTLTCESDRFPTETHFHVGAFDQAAYFSQQGSIFPEELLPWLHKGDA